MIHDREGLALEVLGQESLEVRKGLEEIERSVHADIVEVISKAEEITSLLDEVDLRQSHLFVDDKHDVLVCFGNVMEASSDLVGAPVDAGVVSFWVSGIS